MSELSKDYIIQKIEGHKDLIRAATDRLSNNLFKYEKQFDANLELNEEGSLEMRKILHEIVSELSMIGGFCDKWTQGYICKIVNDVGKFSSSKIVYVDALLLEWWAMRINGIVVDYGKTPFKLLDLKPIFALLQEGLKKIK